MKKITLLLALLCAIATASAETFTVGNLCYYKMGANVEVTYGENYPATLNGVLDIPSQVTYNGVTYPVIAIDCNAFNSCTGLTSVNLPESITAIYWNAFSHCENLTSIQLPSNLKSIDWGAFSYCTSLTSITIPASVVSINGIGQSNNMNSPFYRCDNLVSIVIESGNQYYDSRDNCNAVVETATNTLIFACKGTAIPSSVIIGQNAFKECTMTTIDVTEGVTTIEPLAFNFCTSLKTVTLPSSLTSLGMMAFNGCSALTDIYAYPAGGSVNLGPQICLQIPDSIVHACNLHVYPQDYDYYSTADQWKEFNVIGDLGQTPVYILGEVGENSWAPNVGQQMIYDAATQLYTADITCDGRNDGYNYFSFTTRLADNADDWNSIAGCRFGAVSNGDFLVTDQWLGKELSLTYNNGQAYKIPQGEYNLKLNLETMKLIITKTTALFGDITGDGRVDIEDVNAVINIVLGKATQADYPGNANIVDDNDQVDVQDMNAIINIILGKTSE